MPLNFIVKKSHNVSNKDVSITASKGTVYITFRNNADKQIGRTGFVSVAISGKRLYFKEADSSWGYKLRSEKSRTSVSTSIKNIQLNEWATKHSGNYILEFDRTIALYYVDTE